MSIPFLKCIKQSCKNFRGFTLVEVLVVMVIVGILATGVVFMFADPTAKVKAAAFEMRGDFNLARAVAVKENEDVRIDFDTVTDSYRIWLDDWDDGATLIGTPPQDNTYTLDDPATAAKDGDTLVKEVVFNNKVKYYKIGATPPTGGPVNDPSGNPLDGENGITLGATTLTFKSNGTCDNSGSVVVYYPKDGNPATLTVKGRPYAVVVDSISTGNVRLERWRPEKNDWFRK
jgi:prepilin-type N-terminal cleavage/methylation domain-containing protein